MPTKIEFFRRGLRGEKPLEPVDAGIIHTYRLHPVIVQHHSVHTAFARKFSALPLRGQVFAYLEPEYQDHYGNRRTWNELQEQDPFRAFVAERIKAIRSAGSNSRT
ncbi:MAG: hypothetical protein CMLOHMNK_01354 [Steroidobacteraceae bacterium]|nr:hypothetical protein [Steroidobacteraceae bacterium]